MEGTYDVMLGVDRVGSVTLSRTGLYCHISCRCRLSGETMQELVVSWPDGSKKLGLLTPMDGTFGLKTRIVAKNLGQGSLRFTLCPRHSTGKGQFYPVKPEEPFDYLHRLESAFLLVQNGQMGLGFRDEK